MVKTVAIIGRPNVGKSTLFNRLLGKKISIVANEPGVTRDYIIDKYHYKDSVLELIDTAGIQESNKKDLSKALKGMSKIAIEKSDAILFVLDSREELTSDDFYLSRLIRKSGKKVILVANKCETLNQDNDSLSFNSLGFGDPINVSAEHDRGMSDLKTVLNRLEEFSYPLNKNLIETTEDFPIKISILGRPNSGKSTLTNFLLKEERQLVGAESGLTRDAVSLEFNWKGNSYIIIDTPGLRKKSKINNAVERIASKTSLKSVEESDVSILMIDASIGFDKQDLNIANFIENKGKPFSIAINKWDLVKSKRTKKIELIEKIKKSLPQLGDVSIIFISSHKGSGINELMKKTNTIFSLGKLSISTNNLNLFMEKITSIHSHPNVKGKEIRFKYITQTNTNPLSFIIFVNKPRSVIDSYNRYILNKLREEFNLDGVPVRIFYRKSENPYHH